MWHLFFLKWGIRIFFLHCKNGRALVLPVDMRRKGEDGLGQFGPALFACKALPFVSCKKKMPMPHCFNFDDLEWFKNSCVLWEICMKYSIFRRLSHEY